MKKSTKMRITLEMRLEDIYKALRERDIEPSVANVRLLRTYLETTAQNAANTALVDFGRNEVPLVTEYIET